MSQDKNYEQVNNTPAGCDDAKDDFLNQQTTEDKDDFTYVQGMKMVIY